VGVKTISIQQAMQMVADNPVMSDDNLLEHKVHELVCRSLFEIANEPQMRVRGSMTKANVARNMIFTRLVGRRRAGSHPATRTKVEVEFVDLTGKEVGA
jgi:uncharacterized membrane protein (UPF0127 family)